jgi:hypothetical protein
VFRANHFKASSELGKPGAQVHFVFKLLENIVVVEVGVREQAVEAANDHHQVGGGRLRNRDS